MFFLPLLIGIVAAVILTFGVYVLRNKGFSINTIYAYTLTQLLLGVLIVVYGYTAVRGFEGFVYMQLGTPIVLLSLISLIVNVRNSNKVISG